MATEVARLTAYLDADTKRFDRGMRQSESTFSKVGKTIGKVALGVGAAIGVGLGITAKVGFDEFMEGQKVVAQTNAVLESTGGIANVTAKEVDALSVSLMKKSGVDDEAIASGENLLLTFTQIRNEAGKGNDIFKQATEATLDLATAMGMDATKAALQVGKALNDPFRGYTRLQRIGVAFTKDQVKLIEGFEKSGDVMGAQKVILAELNKEFGGSAEAAGKTLPGQLNILKETFRNVASEIIQGAMPALLAVANFSMDHVIPALGKVADFMKQVFQGNLPPLKLEVIFGGVSALGKNLFDSIQKMLMGSAGTLKPLKLDTGKIVEFERVGQSAGLVKSLQEMFEKIDWSSIGKRVGKNISDAMEVSSEWLNNAFNTASDWLDSHQDELSDLGAKMILGIVNKLTDPTFWAKNWELVLGVALLAFPLGRVGAIGGKFALFFLKPLERLIPSGMGRIIARGVDEIGHQFRRLPPLVQEVFRRAATFIIAQMRRAWNWIKTQFGKLPGILQAAFKLGFIVTWATGVIHWVNIVIGWIKQLIDWIGKIHLPFGIGGGNPGATGGDTSGRSNRGGPRGAPSDIQRFVPRAAAGGGGVTINVHGAVVDGDKLVRLVRNAQQTYGRKGGLI